MDMRAPNLLNDDGTASMATLFMTSHHALRRDAACFAAALRDLGPGDTSRLEALRTEWQRFHAMLHGHHQVEDTAIFQDLHEKQPQLRGILDRLSSDHRRIDPMLERGDRAFADLPAVAAARQVIGDLGALLDEHLALEEAEIVPFLRSATDFPAPANDEEAAMVADGFAWSCHGVAPHVVERVFALLPDSVLSRLPAARRAFDERCVRVWGSAHAGAATTPIPDL